MVLGIGEWAAQFDYRSAPPAIVDKALVSILHGFEVAAAGAGYGHAERAVEALGALPHGPSTVLLTGERTDPASAALANSVLLHARVQEDTHLAAHLGTVVLPVALAVAQAEEIDGGDFLSAVIVGYEVGGVLSRGMTPFTTPKGFRGSPLFGPGAGAAAAARAMGLGAPQTAAAIATACAFAGGTTEPFAAGSDEWHFQNGMSAFAAVFAARLAVAGANGAISALDGEFGFAAAYAGDSSVLDDAAEKLGKDWALEEVMFKRYPVCAYNQSPGIAAVRLHEALSDRIDEIDHVTVEMRDFEAAYPGIDFSGPFSNIGQTLMSTNFTVAAAIAHGELTKPRLEAFDDEPTRRVLERLELVGQAERDPLTVRIVARLADGSELSEELAGDPSDALVWDMERARELGRAMAKERGAPESLADRLADAVSGLTSAPGVDKVTEAVVSYNGPT